MDELGFASTMQLLGTRNGVSFYAARRADGHFCFALASETGKGVSCDLDGTFPSPQRPVFVFPPLRRLAGFAADGVTSVAALDASGQTLDTAPVEGNVFASPSPLPQGEAVSIEARDANGAAIWSWRLPGR